MYFGEVERNENSVSVFLGRESWKRCYGVFEFNFKGYVVFFCFVLFERWFLGFRVVLGVGL